MLNISCSNIPMGLSSVHNFKIKGQFFKKSGHFVNFGHLRTTFKISGISGQHSGLMTVIDKRELGYLH